MQSSNFSVEINSQLNQARVQESQIEYSSSRKSNSSKILPSDLNESFSFTQSLASILASLRQEDHLQTCSRTCTPIKMRQNEKTATDGKTITIKGKKGLLHRDICPICLNQFNWPKGQLACKHIFCGQCIQTWAGTSTNCPCCRKPYSQITLYSKQGTWQKKQVQEKQADFKEQDYYMCYNCGRGDDENLLLICDSCDFYCCHIFCDEVLKNNIPEGDWFCKYCERNLRSSHQIIMDQSFSSIQPSQFSLGTVNSLQDKPIATRTRSTGQMVKFFRDFRNLRRRRN